MVVLCVIQDISLRSRPYARIANRTGPHHCLFDIRMILSNLIRKNPFPFERQSMTKSLLRIIFLLHSLIAVVFITSCNIETLKIGPVNTDSTSVEMGGAHSLQAEFSMGTGSINLSGGAANLLDGTVTYNVADWRPEVLYTVEDEIGILNVNQPSYKDTLPVNIGDVEYEWDLQLNSNLPMDLLVTVGAGEGDLDLSDLQLDSFEFKGGAGGVSIDLSGSSVNDLDVALGAGDVVLDLGGEWFHDVKATIKGGLGRVTLILPASGGVKVTTQGMLSKITAPGFANEGGVYTNDAFGQSDVSFLIDIESGIGEIVMELGA